MAGLTESVKGDGKEEEMGPAAIMFLRISSFSGTTEGVRV